MKYFYAAAFDIQIKKQDKIQSPKTYRSLQKISVSDSLLKLIDEYSKKLFDYSPSDRLFPYTKYYLHYVMDKYSEKTRVKRICLHDLRHSHASLLINLGFDTPMISERLGHENIETTL